jgi:hypothetical protein
MQFRKRSQQFYGSAVSGWGTVEAEAANDRS